MQIIKKLEEQEQVFIAIAAFGDLLVSSPNGTSTTYSFPPALSSECS